MSPRSATPWRLAELAEALRLEFDGDGALEITGAAPLDEAGPGQLAAVYDARKSSSAATSSAGVLIVDPGGRDALAGRNVILADAPKAAFARAIALLHPEAAAAEGVHPSAVVDESARLGPRVSVGPAAVVGAECRIGAGAAIGAGAVIGPHVTIGADARIHARAVLYAETEVGPRCEILAGAVVGAPGFGHAKDAQGRVVRVPHVGRVVLEEEVEVGANATIDRATFGVTRIGARTKIDNLVQIGHNVAVGQDVRMAAQSGLSGSVTVGDGVVMGGQSGVADHRTVGDGAAIAAKSAVFRDVGPGEAVAGIPALPIRTWRRIVAAQERLPKLLREWRASRR